MKDELQIKYLLWDSSIMQNRVVDLSLMMVPNLGELIMIGDDTHKVVRVVHHTKHPTLTIYLE